MGSDTGKVADIHRRVLWNTLSNYIGKVIALGTWFFLTPFVLRHLGQSTYGIWILVGSLVAYGSIFDFGIAGAITKYVAQYHTQKDYEQAHTLVATALWLFTGSGLIVMLLGAILAPWFPWLFHVPPGQSNTASWAVFLAGISLGISLPAAATTAVLRGLQRFDLVNVLNIAGTMIYAAAVLAILMLGGGLVGIVAATIPVTLLMQIPAIWMIYRIAPELKYGWRGASRENTRTVAGFSSALFVINIAGQLQQKTDEVVIGAYLPISSVTPYGIAHRLSDNTQVLTDQFMKVLMPLASQLNSEHDHARLRLLYITSTRLALACFLVIGGCIVVMAGPFLTLWVGPAYASAVPLVILLTAAGMMNTLMWPAGSVLQGIEKHHLYAITSLGSGIINLILSIILVRPLGTPGVALGTLIPTSVQCIFFVLPYTFRLLGIRLKNAVEEIFLPVITPAIPFFAILFILREAFKPASYWMIAFICAMAVSAYGIGYLLLKNNLHERQVLVRLAREVLQSRRTYS